MYLNSRTGIAIRLPLGFHIAIAYELSDSVQVVPKGRKQCARFLDCDGQFASCGELDDKSERWIAGEVAFLWHRESGANSRQSIENSEMYRSSDATDEKLVERWNVFEWSIVFVAVVRPSFASVLGKSKFVHLTGPRTALNRSPAQSLKAKRHCRDSMARKACSGFMIECRARH
ncbi:hypothetical protein EJ02DRAFT_213997 [Clathrospora elynae]|uniref:Uncharacterized protein n=1 Tax=Clathrospora elynae TaxID=706981 RepID=A0A6A5SNC2_9PLEO|nr:hypothetical protein EJ02DRAFT_213997 [Clathrospora elynae]